MNGQQLKELFTQDEATLGAVYNQLEAELKMSFQEQQKLTEMVYAHEQAVALAYADNKITGKNQAERDACIASLFSQELLGIEQQKRVVAEAKLHQVVAENRVAQVRAQLRCHQGILEAMVYQGFQGMSDVDSKFGDS